MQIAPHLADELVALGRFAAMRGWVPATSGNFSCRLGADRAAVTRSGIDKGAMTREDLIVVALDQPLPAGVSAETPLHVARYRTDSKIGAIGHIHSVAATVLSRVESAQGFIEIEGYEMQKALEGFTTHESSLRIPVFGNAQDTQALSERIEQRLGSDCAVPGYLLAGHGMYAWGANIANVRRHLEGLEFLLQCVLEERRIRS